MSLCCGWTAEFWSTEFWTIEFWTAEFWTTEFWTNEFWTAETTVVAMGDWSYLSSLLDKVQSHSTVVGKIWMSVLFLFRIFVLGAAADQVWGDEASAFTCDVHEPGCELACHDWRFPMSFVNFWVLQIVSVTSPTLVYLGYAVHVVHGEKKRTGAGLKSRYTDERGKVQIKGVLFCAYMAQLVSKILLEVGFSVGQFFVFGGFWLSWRFHCQTIPPCPEYSGALCFVSRPTEKTVFIVFMLAVSGVSVLLNMVEIVYLVHRQRRTSRKQQQVLHRPARAPEPDWGSNSPPYGGFEVLPVHREDAAGLDKEKKT
ncbi:gap junction Cx32.2 protein-like [Cololabis saira]|uniref:gap junction Cx32.2 protein-like n=1 Tax=Cololabis saira TaxID=129043 RepID=UPI002AD3A396|nr:gap junction Cx32.2 protein-like [Cololabis saira]